MTTQTLHLIDEYLTQGGYTPGIDGVALYDEAHLVAAAPDLLAALEALLDDALALGLADSPLSGSAIEARTAINKAKGN
jgi:hypothetical protein